MIARAILLGLIFFVVAFAFFWAVLRTRQVTKDRVIETIKAGTIIAMSIAAATLAVGVITLAERI